MSQKPHLALIDASGMLHRAWAVSQKQTNEAGMEVGAAVTFSLMIMKLVKRMDQGNFPVHEVCVFFDPAREGTWRRDLSPHYKADRPDHDPQMLAQIPLMRAMCEAIGMKQGVCETHEADDMIAAYCEDAHEAGMNVSVISSDKDLMQLVRPGVRQLNPASDVWFNAAAVEAKMGVPPDLVADLLALTGDTSDGVAGAPGIGPKSAASLLREFGSLSELLARSEAITRPSWKTSITAHADTIRLARRLVSLDAPGCPRPFTLSETPGPRAPEVRAALDLWVRDVLPGYSADDSDPTPG